MLLSDIRKSRYLNKDDVTEKSKILTIREVVWEELESDDGTEKKAVIHWEEDEKGLVLNSTNFQIAERITGEKDSDNWAGTKVEIYHDPNVSFGGKLTGGIRLREWSNIPY
jgi:hypothetical protein